MTSHPKSVRPSAVAGTKPRARELLHPTPPTDPSDRQNLADTTAGASGRPDALTPFPLHPRDGQDSWFVRSGAILSRRTLFDTEEVAPVHHWTRGWLPTLLAATGIAVAAAVVLFLALS